MEIFIVPINFSNTSLLNVIVENLSRIIRLKINIASIRIEIENAYSPEGKQYYSTQILSNAISETTRLDGKVLLLTEFDLFIPVFTYIFGEAQLRGKHSIVSICRFHEEFYSGITNNALLIERTLKEILHELGHNFGLIHCRNWDCVMHSSAGVEEIDMKGNYFCKECFNQANL